MKEPKEFSKCGMRCDLCLIYHPNVEKEDRRVEICNEWRKNMCLFCLKGYNGEQIS